MLAVVLLTYRRRGDDLRATLHSVMNAGDAEVIVVVDNGDGAEAALGDLVDGRAVHLLTTGSNLGYAGGMNVGIRAALTMGAANIALLNDDLLVEPGWLAPLAARLDADDDLGAVQPVLLQASTVPPIVNSMGVVISPDGAGVDLHRGQSVDRMWPEVIGIDTFTGGAVLLRSAFVRDVGLFDERYFLYYEDVDLAARGRRRGWRYACVPASRVWHEGSASTAMLGNEQRFYQERNRLWSTFAHGSRAQICGALWLSLRRLRHAPHGVHARALLAGVAGAPRAFRHRA